MRKGYRFNGNRNFALQLTKPHPTKRFQLTGAPEMIPLQGIRKNTLDRVLQFSDSVEQAAQQIEALSLGSILEPDVGPGQRAVQELDEATIERIVQNRTENVLAQKDDEHAKQIREMRAEMEEMRRMIAESSKPATRKKAAKKGRKNRNVVQDTIESLGEPELDEDQQAMLKGVDFGPSA